MRNSAIIFKQIAYSYFLLSLYLAISGAVNYTVSSSTEIKCAEDAVVNNEAGFQGTGTSSKSKTVNFASAFTAAPKVILGIVELNIAFSNVQSTLSWNLSVSSITTSGFQIAFAKKVFYINKVTYRYLAINSSKAYTSTGIITYQSKLDNGGPGARQNFSPARALATGEKRLVSAFIIGIEKVKGTTSEQNNYYIQVEPLSNDTFDIVVYAVDTSSGTTITKIYYNYIEYYHTAVELPNNFVDSLYSTSAGALTNTPGSARSVSGSPLAFAPLLLTKLFYGIKSVSFDPAGSIGAIALTSTLNTSDLTFTYTAAATSLVEWVDAEVIAMQVITCNDAGFYYCPLFDSCYATCPDGSFTFTDYKSRLICETCHASCKTCTGALATECQSCNGTDNLIGNQCVPCHATCNTCSGPLATDCLSCNGTDTLSGGQCVSACDSTCLTCSGQLATNCLTCISGKTLSGGSCVSCDASCLTCSGALATECLTCSSGKTISGGSCVPCDASCLTCSGTLATNCLSCSAPNRLSNNQCINTTACQPGQYSYNLKCLDAQPPQTFCNAQLNCFKCPDACKECAVDQLVCSSCYEGMQLSNNTCVCTDSWKKYDSSQQKCSGKDSVLSEETIATTAQALDNMSQASMYMSIAFAFSSGLLNAGSPLLSQMLTIQKTFYLLLIDVDPPLFLYQFISSLTNKGIFDDFSGINVFSRLAHENALNETIGYKFEKEQISRDFLLNAGGGVMVVFIITIVLIIFIGLSMTMLYRIVIYIYERIIIEVLIEVYQIIILVFTFSMVISFVETKYIEPSAIPFLIGCSAYILVILSGQPIILWKDRHAVKDQLARKTIKSIFIEKLSNGCKKDQPQTLYFMTIFVSIECVFFPLVVICSRSNAVVSGVMLFLLQLTETGLGIKIRPFINKTESIIFILEQSIFLMIFFLYTVLTLILVSEDPNETMYPNSVIIISFLITFFMVAAVVLNPIIKLIKLIIVLRELCAHHHHSEHSEKTIPQSDQEQLNLIEIESVGNPAKIRPTSKSNSTQLEVISQSKEPALIDDFIVEETAMRTQVHSFDKSPKDMKFVQEAPSFDHSPKGLQLEKEEHKLEQSPKGIEIKILEPISFDKSPKGIQIIQEPHSFDKSPKGSQIIQEPHSFDKSPKGFKLNIKNKHSFEKSPKGMQINILKPHSFDKDSDTHSIQSNKSILMTNEVQIRIKAPSFDKLSIGNQIEQDNHLIIKTPKGKQIDKEAHSFERLHINRQVVQQNQYDKLLKGNQLQKEQHSEETVSFDKSPREKKSEQQIIESK